MKIHTLPPAVQNPDKLAPLRDAAVELEAAFLAEMLRSGGLGKSSEIFGGGVGEDQFSSMLVQQQARQLAQAGGIGLSEILFNSLVEQSRER